MILANKQVFGSFSYGTISSKSLQNFVIPCMPLVTH
jgi:hypothetical protein